MSAYTKTLLCNMALSHCGISPSISDIEVDETNEAIQCRLWYETVRGSLLEMMPWSFAQIERVATLYATEPNDRWAFAYYYPNDVRRINGIIVPGQKRPERAEDKPKFDVKRAPDGNGKIIYTDVKDALLDMNIDVSDTTQFTDVYALAFSLFLATYISKPLRVKASIKADIQNDWAAWLSEAQIQHKSESQEGIMPDSEFVSGRM